MTTRTAFTGSLSMRGWEPTHGENHRQARLTDDQVREIRKAIEQPEVLAIKYGVTAGHILNLKRRRRRKDVKD